MAIYHRLPIISVSQIQRLCCGVKVGRNLKEPDPSTLHREAVFLSLAQHISRMLLAQCLKLTIHVDSVPCNFTKLRTVPTEASFNLRIVWS